MKPVLEVSGALRVEYRVQLARLEGEADGAVSLIQSERRSVGGSAGVCALAAARLGATVRLRGWVGDDSHGRFLLEQLQVPGLEASVEVRAGAVTPYAIVIRASHWQTQTLLSPEAAQSDGAHTWAQLLESLQRTLGEVFEPAEVARRVSAYEASFGELSAFDCGILLGETRSAAAE